MQRRHRQALDFQKSGIRPDKPTPAEKIATYPDFMQKSQKSSRSKKILGQLYRKAARIDRIYACAIDSDDNRHATVDITMLEDQISASFSSGIGYPDGFELVLANALATRDRYTKRLRQILDEYGVETEGQLFSGHMLIRRRSSDREKDAFTLFNTERMIREQLALLWAQLRAEFFAEFGLAPETKFSRKAKKQPSMAMQQKASAWYLVVYDPNLSDAKADRFLSFPWIVWDVLVRVRAARQPVDNGGRGSAIEMKLRDEMADHELKRGERAACAIEPAVHLVMHWLRVHSFSPETTGGASDLFDGFIREYAEGCSSATSILQFLRFVGTHAGYEWLLKRSRSIPRPQLAELNRLAFATYHTIALTGTLRSLTQYDAGESQAGLRKVTEMDPIYITREDFGSVVDVDRIRAQLAAWSDCDEVQIRETTSLMGNCGETVTLSVSARGTLFAQFKLREILMDGRLALCLARNEKLELDLSLE